MIRIAKDDVLRGLKSFKRLAKQDLLASALTSNPQFWSMQAEARRKQYGDLMEIVENDGVDVAYRQALQRYASLPRIASGETGDPEVLGRQQALEMFFTMLGVDSHAADEAPQTPPQDGSVEMTTISGALSQA